MEQKVSVGRIVWYQRHGSPDGTHKPEVSPAIVTAVTDEGLSLHVINPNGVYFNHKTQYDASETPKGGTWRWPDRV